VPVRKVSTGGTIGGDSRSLYGFRLAGTQILVFNLAIGGVVRLSFPHHDIVHVVLVCHLHLILISGSGFQEGLIGHEAAAIPQKRGTGKDEHQATPPIRRYPDIDRRSTQLNSPLVLGSTIDRHPMDIDSRVHA